MGTALSRRAASLPVPGCIRAVDCPELCTCCAGEAPPSLRLHCDLGYKASALTRFLADHMDLHELAIKSSYLAHIPEPILSMSQLTTLDLSQNHIIHFASGAFANLTSLRTLNLDDNRVKNLAKGCMNGLRKLTSLSMQNNGISDLDAQVFLDDTPQLTSIDLSYNLLREIDTWPLVMASSNDNSRRDPHIHLDHNRISRMVNTLNVTIHDLSSQDSVYVSLQHNLLTHRDDFNFVRLLDVDFALQLVVMWNMAFDVRSNPWDCGCDMYQFVNFVEPMLQFFNRSLHDLNLIQIFCASPAYNKGKLVYKMPLTDFRCHEGEHCPRECDCVRVPANDTMLVTCQPRQLTSLPQQLPRQHNIVMLLSGGNITTLEKREYLNNVSLLDVSSNGLRTVDYAALQQLSENVQTLHLNDNNMRQPPPVWQNVSWPAMRSLRLDGNPYQCDCGSVSFRNWLLQHQNLVDKMGNVLCYDERHRGAPLINLSEADLCGTVNPSPLLVATITLGAALCLVVLLIIIASTRVRRGLTSCLFKKKMARIAKLDDDEEKTFSAFVVYGVDGSAFVEEALKPLEDEGDDEEDGQQRIKLCLHHRDFIPGQLISDNIMDSIRRSYAVVVVLTREFLKSDWCLFECEMSRTYQAQVGVHNLPIIPIYPTDDERAHLNSTSCKRLAQLVKGRECLVGSDGDFREKLLRILRAVCQPTDPEQHGGDRHSLLG